MKKKGTVYILASKKNGTLYTGVTSDLPRRLFQHEIGKGSQFAQKYGAKRLVWFETYDMVAQAITREKTIKKWPRQWKINKIEENNPEWHDLRKHLL